ncbi:hypothetical protein COO60DRAFT_1642297 [Scenedesmus sp. NREL 46B-D3]|nr:hypothetical protein COO60DRAFT_1642297 [Scenedesmus sp. NREL 46B-D3]
MCENDDTGTAAAVAAAAAAAVDAEGLKQLLFWACHFTVAGHKAQAAAGPADKWQQPQPELCRLLQDNQQQRPQVKALLVAAVVGLLQGASTAHQGAQLLCMLSGNVFPEQQLPPQGQCGKKPAHKLQQQQASNAAAAAASRTDTVLLQLELLALVLRSTPGAAVPGVGRMACCQVAALLAAAMLPVLLPAAMMGNAAVRRLWLGIASTAAGAAPAAAAGAAAASAAQCAGVAALASAAAWDRDANIRSKALTLLTDAAPNMWRHVAACRQTHTIKGLPGDDPAPPATEASRPSSSSVGSCPAVTAALQAQLLGSSKACRAKALQLLQQLLSDPSEVLAAAAQHTQQRRNNTHEVTQQQQQQQKQESTHVQQEVKGQQQQQQQQHQASMQEAAAELLLSVQLLELAGGCSSPMQQPRDFKGEVAILADALDWCCFCMASVAAASRVAKGGAAPANAAATAAVGAVAASEGHAQGLGAVTAGAQHMSGLAHEGKAAAEAAVGMEHDVQSGQQPNQGQQQHPEQQQQCFAVSTSTLQDLLTSLLRILHKAANTAAADDSKQPAASQDAGAVQNSLPAASSGVSQLLLAGLGSTLLHHLELVVSLAACSAESAAALPAQLHVEVLGHYVQVLCVANTGRQFLLHELLLSWHTELASSPPSTAPITAAGAAAAAAAAAADQDDAAKSEPGAAAFDYMLGEEERQWVEESTAKFTSGLLAETAPACYLPVLLQLLAGPEVPTHVQVLALQALQPLLLVSPALCQQHSTLIEALLADPSTPAGLQLQAVTAAGQLIAARPAQSQGLVLQLEQLLLRGLAAAAADASPAAAATRANASEQQTEHGQQPKVAQLEETTAAALVAESAGYVDVLCCAAGVYAVLLLGEKLLLAPRSWTVVAAGLAAAGQLQDHLLAFLRPKDLASDELQLPLLAALGQAAQGGSWGAAVQPLAALLAACCPSTRCLDTLAGLLHASKRSLSLHSCPDTLALLTTSASNYKPANSNRTAAIDAAAEDWEAEDYEDESAAAAAAADLQRLARERHQQLLQYRAAKQT